MCYQKFSTPNGKYLFEFKIYPNGIIKLLLGNLKVEGVSISQADTSLSKKADEFINVASDNINS